VNASPIETARLRFRLPVMDDLGRLAALQADPEMMRYYHTTRTREETRESIERRIRHHEEHGYGLWALELKETGEYVGNAGLIEQELDGEPFTEIGWFVDRRFWGRGLATEAARASRDWAFANLDRERLVSFIVAENLASVSVAQKIGMTYWKKAEWKGYEVSVYSIARIAWRESSSFMS
jgi:RimJ/RimL family protein N-acetyltransferase